MTQALLSKIIIGCLAVVTLAGCTGEGGPATVNASGVVTLDGKPVEKAQVIFISDAGTNPTSAMTDAQGHFSLSYNGEKKGAIPGNYKVQVSKTVMETKGEGGTEIKLTQGLPAKYANIVTSGLTLEVPQKGTSDLKIDLKSK